MVLTVNEMLLPRRLQSGNELVVNAPCEDKLVTPKYRVSSHMMQRAVVVSTWDGIECLETMQRGLVWMEKGAKTFGYSFHINVTNQAMLPLTAILAGCFNDIYKISHKN